LSRKPGTSPIGPVRGTSNEVRAADPRMGD
jgi:hypothetical protein